MKARYVPSGTSIGEQATFRQSDVVLLQIAPSPTKPSGNGFQWKWVIIAGAITGAVILAGVIFGLDQPIANSCQSRSLLLNREH